jgi:hypothetical protein
MKTRPIIFSGKSSPKGSTVKGESMSNTSIASSIERLRIVDSYGIEWANLLRDPDTDQQMAADCVAIVREYLRDSAPELRSLLMEARDALTSISGKEYVRDLIERIDKAMDEAG